MGGDPGGRGDMPPLDFKVGGRVSFRSSLIFRENYNFCNQGKKIEPLKWLKVTPP